MITKLNLYKESILVPRNIEGRKEKQRQETIKFLQQEVINGDLQITEVMLSISSELVKVKVINGNLYCSNIGLDKLPEWFSKIEKIKGWFVCSFNKLETLENCPQNIDGAFYCDHNNLTTLKGCPKIINDYFWCSYNALTSLEYGPIIVKNNYYCYNNANRLSIPMDCTIFGSFIS